MERHESTEARYWHEFPPAEVVEIMCHRSQFEDCRVQGYCERGFVLDHGIKDCKPYTIKTIIEIKEAL